MFFFGFFSSIVPYLATLIIMCIYMIAGSPNEKSQGNQEFATEESKIIILHTSDTCDKMLSSKLFFKNYCSSFESEKQGHITLYPPKVKHKTISKIQGNNTLSLTSRNGINAPPIV